MRKEIDDIAEYRLRISMRDYEINLGLKKGNLFRFKSNRKESKKSLYLALAIVIFLSQIVSVL